MSEKAAFIILASNTADFADKCIQSIRKETKWEDYEIILVNNGSNSEETDKLLRIKGVDEHIHSKTNKGFAGGMNMGIRSAMLIQAEYIFLLNCDTLVTPNWATQMIRCSNETGAGIVGCLSNYVCEAEQQIQSYQGKTPGCYINVSSKPDSFIVFLVVLLRRSTVKKLGYLDEIFNPINYEDNDYCMRAKINGIKLKIDGFTYIWHNPGSVPTQRTVPDRAIVFKRNRKVYHEKWKEEREPMGLGI